MAAIVAAVWYRHPAVWIPAGGLALGALLVGLLAPWVLRPLNLIWFRFSMLLYRIVNPMVMLLVYAVAIVPTGLIMQALRDPLRAKCPPGSKTYWIKNPTDSCSGSMKNQF
jgi:predicted Co/Zn/Cd cation transporter (cation efflux family)